MVVKYRTHLGKYRRGSLNTQLYGNSVDLESGLQNNSLFPRDESNTHIHIHTHSLTLLKRVNEKKGP